MKSIFVATVGTRDLMFQVASGEWFNLGDDQMKNDILTEHSEVIDYLKLSDFTSHRDLTEYLYELSDQFIAKIKPVIMGKIFEERHEQIEKVFLIGTDQNEAVIQRNKDTIYSALLIQKWLNHYFPKIKVEVIPLGREGENPSHFEEMFSWWTGLWNRRIKPQPSQKLWVCLKGGVGQTAEASRISGLGVYGEQIEFFEITQTPKENRLGFASDYSGPFLGKNYLWTRVQKESLNLLKNHNYLAVQELLLPYFQEDSQKWQKVRKLLRGAIAWNQGKFDGFYQECQAYLDDSQRRQRGKYWWQAYEQGYTAVIRFEQNNTTEAMLHSFRTIEGLINLWIKHNFPNDIVNANSKDESLKLKLSVTQKYPELKQYFVKYDKEKKGFMEVRGEVQSSLIQTVIPSARQDTGFHAWNSQEARNIRNALSHNLGGISEQELFKAWGQGIRNKEAWEERLLRCINLITGETFGHFRNASFFPAIQHLLRQEVKNLGG